MTEIPQCIPPLVRAERRMYIPPGSYLALSFIVEDIYGMSIQDSRTRSTRCSKARRLQYKFEEAGRK